MPSFSGSCICPAGEYHFKNGLLHKDKGAAVTCRSRFGHIYEEYWREGKLYRKDGPAIRHGMIREEFWGFKDARPNERRNNYSDGLGPAVKSAAICKPLLLDSKFEKIERLSCNPQPAVKYPFIEGKPLADHLDEIFGGNCAFGLLGDYGILPQKLLDLLDIDLGSDVTFKIDYSRKWQDFPGRDPAAHYDPDHNKNPWLNPELGVLDYLGTYCCNTKQLTLHLSAIAECAARLDRVLGGKAQSCAMTLATLVFYHELGHAIDHHSRGGITGDNLGGTDRCETIAQYIAIAVTREYGTRGLVTEAALSQKQPLCYSLWKYISPTPEIENIKNILKAPLVSIRAIIPKDLPQCEGEHHFINPTHNIPYEEYWSNGILWDQKAIDAYKGYSKDDQKVIHELDLPDF